MNSNNTEKKYQAPIGALWVKESEKGKYFSMVVNINGVDHTFFGFKNTFKDNDGAKAPDYKIYLPKERAQNQAGQL